MVKFWVIVPVFVVLLSVWWGLPLPYGLKQDPVAVNGLPVPPRLTDFGITPLEPIQVTEQGSFHHPETFSVNSQGHVCAPVIDGHIRCLNPNTEEVYNYARVPGRGLGIFFDESDNLWVADGLSGLVRIDNKTKDMEIVSQVADGKRINFADDVVVASSGQVYFTDASEIAPLQTPHEKSIVVDTLSAARIDLLTGVGSGRLLRYNPETKSTDVLMTGLHFANGVTLSANQDFLLVVETGRYRIHRFWIKGPKEGTSEVFSENMPVIPDGISTRPDGSGFWVAGVVAREVDTDFLQMQPLLKKLILKTSLSLMGSKPEGFVLLLGNDGVIQRIWHSPPPSSFGTISAVTERNGLLLLGSLHETHLAVLPINRFF